MEIKTKYDIGHVVFLITDSEQKSRLITGILIRPSGVVYYLISGDSETQHYDLEIAKEKNYVL